MVSKAICYHLPVFLYYLYVVMYDFVNNNHGRGRYGGRLQFLTVWNEILQTLYFGIATLNDFCGSDVRPSHSKDIQGRKSVLQKLRDILLASVVFPAGTFVVCTFWGIYAVDRELISPKSLDGLIPVWINHALHTFVLPLLIVELAIVYHQFPRKRTGLAIVVIFALAYLIWILWIAYVTDFWVYPFLKVMPAYYRVIWIGAFMVFFPFLYLIGDFINKTLWGKDTRAGLMKMKRQ
ncbi:androgen-induced gene 1 protein-like [Mizuhopecten yessoensis]|uniref:androgen-induced gene 1 protein-like n=1 Tax=Mizuhopecten yessoensis TaxID=6573 RepID=UPI000B4593C0|nr:androgen-induced gene 1 protein-like [Mizuhopecten yessoensis]